MRLELLEPHHGDHSIQNAILAIEWAMALDNATLETLRSAFQQFKHDFPKEELQHTVSFSLGLAQGAVPTPQQGLGGYTYSRFSVGGEIEKQIIISRSNCMFIVSDYKKWSVLIDEAKAIFRALLQSATASVATIGLQYSDRFVWKGDKEELNLDEIFSRNSQYISAHIFDCKDLWHSHHGYFDVVETPVIGKRLDNINVALQDAIEGRALEVLTSHRLQLSNPIECSTALETIDLSLQGMHQINKNIFRQLFTEQLLNKIGMND